MQKAISHTCRTSHLEDALPQAQAVRTPGVESLEQSLSPGTRLEAAVDV